LFRNIPLIDYPGYQIDDESGGVRRVKSPRRYRAITPFKQRGKAPSVALLKKCAPRGIRQYFKIWWLLMIAYYGQDSQWDLRGYRFFKQCWEPGYKDGDRCNYRFKNIELTAKGAISPFVICDDVEYKWWFDVVSDMTSLKAHRFNEKLINAIKENTYKLANEEAIKRFFGDMFRREQIEIFRSLIHTTAKNVSC